MNGLSAHPYGRVLVVSALAAVAICALFSGQHRSLTGGVLRDGAASAPQAGEQHKTWWLGVDLGPVPSTPLRPRGVRIRRLWSHSPARRAGLAAGDVILRMKGTPVYSPADVEALLSAPGSPNRMEMVILRGRKTLSVPVVLQEQPDFALNVGVVLVVLAAVFTLLYVTSLDRVAVLGCGAVVAVVLGTQFGFYDQERAFEAIRMSTLALLLGMGLVTAALEETGFFALMARRIGELSRGDWSRLMVLLCITTFFLSSCMNNLTTILVTLPVTLSLARELRLDPAPFVIGEIISSNLGGASSMIGDFPNMLIASETGRHFHEFLLYMMPPCLIQLAITIWFLKRMKGKSAKGNEASPAEAKRDAAIGGPALLGGANPGKMKEALAVLAAVIAAFFFCGRSGVPPATVALAGGSCILLLWYRAAPRLIGKGGFGDILFFTGLFVLVGCAEASGFLDIVATWMVDVSGGGVLGLALVLMWGAAIVTTFLNAGPTTALFVPIVAGLGVSEPHGLLWWALSLGVCAGSSATVTGATAGPVALTKLDEFVNETKGRAGSAPVVKLSFVSYAKAGVPLMFVFLLVSTAYIWGLSVWS